MRASSSERPASQWVLGVDGGNSKTIALLAGLDGSIVGAGRAGCSDIYGAGSVEQAMVELEAAVEAARLHAGIERRDLVAGAFSMAGADWPEDLEVLSKALLGRDLGKRVTVVNDAMGALRAGTLGGTGVAVVCGTGAAIGARAPSGRQWHTSWWQEPQGSLDLAHHMLRAVYRAELGIDPPTSLRARALSIFEQKTVEAMLHACTARTGRIPLPHARLTSALLDEAAQGDDTAERIVRRHGASLGDYALAAARVVGIADTPFDLVLCGGVLRHESCILRDAIVACVQSAAPLVRPLVTTLEPAVGALLLSLEAVDVPIDEPLLRRVRASLPAPAIFTT